MLDNNYTVLYHACVVSFQKDSQQKGQPMPINLSAKEREKLRTFEVSRRGGSGAGWSILSGRQV